MREETTFIEIINPYWYPNNLGVLLQECNACKGRFIQPWDEKFIEYKYCPICGKRFEGRNDDDDDAS